MNARKDYEIRKFVVGNKKAHYAIMAQAKGIGLSEELRSLHIRINARHRNKIREIKNKIRKEYYEKNNITSNAITNRQSFDIMYKHSTAIGKLFERLSDYV